MKRIIKISLPVVIILILIVTLVSIKNNKQEESILTSTQNLSNKKIGWGIKRNDNHEQPDLGKTNKEILEKSQGLAIGNNVDKNILTVQIIIGNSSKTLFNRTIDYTLKYW